MPILFQPRASKTDVKSFCRRFWQRVSDGLEVNQLWSQFERDARSSYRLYSSGIDRRTEQSRRLYVLHTAKKLFWAILDKLSPARRVLLLLGLVMLYFPGGGFTLSSRTGQIHIVEFDFRFLGGILLFVLLMLEIADRVVMKRDLEIARDIQQWLLPGAPPQIPGFAIAYLTRAANTVAGDYYDVFPRPAPLEGERNVLLAIADVAGKSIPAAMLMATFQASLRTLSDTRCSLPELVAGMNRYACTNSQGGLRFTTAFLGEIDTTTRTLTYINSGHNAPILRRSNGTVERLEAGGLPLGIMPNAVYEAGTVTLAAGDWLVIFTDGMVEAESTRGEEYGEARQLAVIEAGVSLSPAELLQRMVDAVDAFVGNAPQHDDLTCLLVRVS